MYKSILKKKGILNKREYLGPVDVWPADDIPFLFNIHLYMIWHKMLNAIFEFFIQFQMIRSYLLLQNMLQTRRKIICISISFHDVVGEQKLGFGTTFWGLMLSFGNKKIQGCPPCVSVHLATLTCIILISNKEQVPNKLKFVFYLLVRTLK